jgi:integrase
MRAMFNVIVRIGERAGVPGMSPHRLRHRACTDIVRYCVKNGIPEEEILRLTGHSSRGALQPYYEHDMVERSTTVLDGVNDMYDDEGNPKE